MRRLRELLFLTLANHLPRLALFDRTRDVEAQALVGGVPARLIRRLAAPVEE